MIIRIISPEEADALGIPRSTTHIGPVPVRRKEQRDADQIADQGGGRGPRDPEQDNRDRSGSEQGAT
jgi:hypothetical protein